MGFQGLHWQKNCYRAQKEIHHLSPVNCVGPMETQCLTSEKASLLTAATVHSTFCHITHINNLRVHLWNEYCI